MSKKKPSKPIDPESFCREPSGFYEKPKVKVFDGRNLVGSELPKKQEPQPVPREVPREEYPSTFFDGQGYKQHANQSLKDMGSSLRVIDKSILNILIGVLVVMLLVFGIFFIYSVNNNKFKSDFTCPDCKCEQAKLTCPEIDLSKIEQPSCICNQTCPLFNDTAIIQAINNIDFNISG